MGEQGPGAAQSLFQPPMAGPGKSTMSRKAMILKHGTGNVVKFLANHIRLVKGDL
jgi:hypothetical protein